MNTRCRWLLAPLLGSLACSSQATESATDEVETVDGSSGGVSAAGHRDDGGPSAREAGSATGGDSGRSTGAGGRSTGVGGTTGTGGATTGTGGAVGAGGAAEFGGAAPSDAGLPLPVPANLAPANVACTPGPRKALPLNRWTALGPPGVESSSYGLVGITIDPSDPAVLYVTMQDNGIWKSCDAGATWMQLGAPGQDPDVWDDVSNYLDVPFEIAVDPRDSRHLYATVGVRGRDQGFWISFDGGAIWERTPGFRAAGTKTTFDTTDIAVDPTNFQHVLVAGHSWWAGYQNAGVLETTDGGFTWIAHNPEPSWPSGTNGIEFLFDPAANVGNSSTWLNMTSGDGFWRTTDAGGTWAKVGDISSIHGLGVVHRAKSGTWYAGGLYSPVRSSDNGLTWQQDMVGLPRGYYYVVIGDGTSLYTATSMNNGAQPYISFYTSPDADGKTWTRMGSGGSDQTFSDGPVTMKYDAQNHIVYAACYRAGLLALKTAP